MCLAIGAAAFVVIVHATPSMAGTTFVGSVAAYTLWRQLLLPLRAEPRKTTLGRPLTMAVAAAALIADIVVSAIA